MSGVQAEFLADLHIHTALSPCASREMTPPAIVARALARHMAMIAICDHNSVANVAAVQQAAGERLTVVAGCEIATVEEVHVLGLFGSLEDARQVGEKVYQSLGDASAVYFERFGEQSIMALGGEIVAREKKQLACATVFTLSQAVKLITATSGVAIACHVDRPSFSVFSQLGVMPTDVRFDAIELSPHATAGDRRRLEALDLPMLASSDSHFLSDIGGTCSVLRACRPSFEELKLALAGRGGRSISPRA